MTRKIMLFCCLVVFSLGTLVGCSQAPGDSPAGGSAAGDQAPPSTTAAQ